jgi:hypothetical protein
MKHTLYFALLITLALTTGCVVQNSTHTFQYHGTDNIAAGSEFYYVQYGLTGRSSTTYKPTGGGAVREGLVADAKRDLMQNYPLKANQAYANLSIDVIRTTKELQSNSGSNVIEVILQCVISADVIQFGTPPANLSQNPNMQPKVLSMDQLDLPADKNNTQTSQDTPQNTTGTSTTPTITSEATSVETPPSFTSADFAPDDKVKFRVKGDLVEGVVLWVRVGSTYSITATYTDAKGRKKKAYLKPSEIIEKLN